MGGKSHSPIQRGAATPRHHTLEYNDDGDVNVSAPLMSSSNMEAQQKDFLPMFSSSSSSSSSSKKQYYDGVGGESKYGKKTSTADLLNGLSHGAGGGASVLRLNKRSIQLIAGIFMLLFFIPNAYVYLFDKKAATAAAAGGGGDGVEYDTTSKKSRQSTIVAISIPTSTPPTPPLYSFNSKSELLAQCESLQSSIKPHEGDIKPASPKSIPSTFPSTTLPSVVESQYQLLVKPRFPDISEEVFNALPAKCKKYLVGQIPLDDQSISPQGIDGQEFTKVIEWRKNNSDHEVKRRGGEGKERSSKEEIHSTTIYILIIFRN